MRSRNHILTVVSLLLLSLVGPRFAQADDAFRVGAVSGAVADVASNATTRLPVSDASLPRAATPALDERSRDLLAIAALICLLLAGLLLNARRTPARTRSAPAPTSDRS